MSVTTDALADDTVLVVTIDSPPVNALSATVRDGLTTALAPVGEPDSAVRVVILRGGRHRFSAGGDVHELLEPSSPERNRWLHRSFARLYDAVRECPVPVIAAIEGYAMGGGLELALCCDLRYVTPDARLAASAVNMGLVESVRSLVTRVGPAGAAELLYTGESIDGVEAARRGVATACVPADELDKRVLTVATRIASRAPGSVRAVKRLLRAEVEEPARAGALAGDLWLGLRESGDHREALVAFEARRAPVFRGGDPRP